MSFRNPLDSMLRGERVETRPAIGYAGIGSGADGLVFKPLELPSGRALPFAEVVNPFGRALSQGLLLNEILRDDPAQGREILERLAEEVRADLAVARDRGVLHVFYRLAGASPEYCSPMQYGGHYLELDRELLLECRRLGPTILFVEGLDPYIDFVSDLPSVAFGWDSPRIRVEAVRLSREGLLLSTDPSADIEWIAAKGMLDLSIKATTSDCPGAGNRITGNKLPAEAQVAGGWFVPPNSLVGA